MSNLFGDAQSSGSHAYSLPILWRDFQMEIPDEIAATKFLSELMRDGKDLICSFCGCENTLELLLPARIWRCSSCKKKTWFTAGTFFHGIRLLQKWLFGIWLVANGYEFCANQLSKTLETSYDFAWKMLTKIDMPIADKLASQASYIPSESFMRILSKRSRSSPANEAPIQELQEQMQDKTEEPVPITPSNENGNALDESPIQDSASTDDQTASLNDEETLVLTTLSSTPLQFDQIIDITGLPTHTLASTLTILEFGGLVECVVGDRYIIARTKSKLAAFSADLLKTLDATHLEEIDRFIDFVRQHFHGISLKYLQLKLARFWCIREPSAWGFKKLLRLCANSEKIFNSTITNYVSPLAVKMFVPAHGAGANNSSTGTPPCP